MIIACCVMKGSVYTFEMETVSETEVGHSTNALVLSCFVILDDGIQQQWG